MTFQATRVSLFIAERFFTFLRGAIFTLAMGFGLYALVANFSDMREVAGHVVARLAQFEVSATSVKVGLTPENIAAAGQESKEIPDKMKGLLLKNDILSLKESWVIRLLYTDGAGLKCDYPNPTPEMKANVAADRHLAADGLIEMTEDPQLKAEALEAMRKAKAEGNGWTIGEPRSCYRTRLTWRGGNVKTALAEFLGAAFTAVAASTEARAPHPMKVAAASDR
ncbi:rRNA methylase [Methylocystis parvus]|uniref:rRNA methylase n=1 Tax=Methylocystis parvus TaxID=134 RepID=UPI003C728769